MFVPLNLNTQILRVCTLVITFIVMLILLMPVTSAQAFESPKLLILGDSQLTFGGGRPFLRFLRTSISNVKPTGTMTNIFRTYQRRQESSVLDRRQYIHG